MFLVDSSQVELASSQSRSRASRAAYTWLKSFEDIRRGGGGPVAEAPRRTADSQNTEVRAKSKPTEATELLRAAAAHS